MSVQKPKIAKEREIFHDNIQAYTDGGKGFLKGTPPQRAERRTVKDEVNLKYNIGLKDIDETIVYYFNNVIKPSVIQNTKKINVPILYGSPERWASVQKDGYYRDKNGKIQCPLIMFKRTSIEKNRNIGNKLDANSPSNVVFFEKKYSKKNVYDTFSVLSNREPVREYQGVIIPDYVNIVYSCIIFTDYIEQMNKIIESINFASDSYWGDPEKFRFRAMIDSYTTSTELTQGEDRKVRTEFNINLLGYIIPDSINAQINGLNKIYSKSSLSFKIETVGSLETLTARAATPERDTTTRFFDASRLGATIPASGMSDAEITFVSLNTTATADSVSSNLAVFNNKSFAEPPTGFVINQNSFTVYVNGIALSSADRVVQEVGSNIEVTFYPAQIGYNIDSKDQIIMTGKFV